MRHFIALTVASLSIVSCMATQQVEPTTPNTLSAAEVKDGWVLLFDGKDASKSFRGFKRTDTPKEWTVEDGAIVLRGKGGDLATKDEYSDFEFAIDWKITSGGNSGIMWRSSEDFGAPWETGPEMQVLDDAKHADGQSPLTSAGACYALYPAPKGATKPVGEWNHAEISAIGPKVTYTLNGVKTAEFDLSSKEWKDKVAGSKFASMKAFGTKDKGHIVLQDHGDVVMYRNIKIRPIGAAKPSAAPTSTK